MEYRFVSIPAGINKERRIMPLRSDAARLTFFGVDEAWLHEASAVRYEVKNNSGSTRCGRYSMKRMPNHEGMRVLRIGMYGTSDPVYLRDGRCPGVESASAYEKMDFNLDETGPAPMSGYQYTWNKDETEWGHPIKRKHMLELFEAIKRRKYVPSSGTSGGDMSVAGTITNTERSFRDGVEDSGSPVVTTHDGGITDGTDSLYLIYHSWDTDGIRTTETMSDSTYSNVHFSQNTPMVFANIRSEWVNRATFVFKIDVRCSHTRHENGQYSVIDNINKSYYHSLNPQLATSGNGVSLSMQFADLMAAASAAATKAGASDVQCPLAPTDDISENFGVNVKATYIGTIFEIASAYCVPENT